MAILGLGAQGLRLWPGSKLEVVALLLRFAWPAGLSFEAQVATSYRPSKHLT